MSYVLMLFILMKPFFSWENCVLYIDAHVCFSILLKFFQPPKSQRSPSLSQLDDQKKRKKKKLFDGLLLGGGTEREYVVACFHKGGAARWWRYNDEIQ